MMRKMMGVFSVLAICAFCVAMSSQAGSPSVATHAAANSMVAGSVTDVATLSVLPDASVVVFLVLPWIFARFTRAIPAVMSR